MKSIKEADISDRRNFLRTTGAALVAASIPPIASAAGAQTKAVDDSTAKSGPVFSTSSEVLST